MDTFEKSAADFARFAVKQDYPPNLLWVEPTDVVLAKIEQEMDVLRLDGRPDRTSGPVQR